MDYVDCFDGGPSDGKRESDYKRAQFKRFAIRRFLDESGFKRMSIYEYRESKIIGTTTERVFKFLRTVDEQTGNAFLDANDELLP